MSNLCTNNVVIYGDAEQLKNFGKVAKLLTAKGKLKYNPELDFEAIYPCDKRVMEKQKLYEKKYGSNALSPELYQWRKTHWGTECNVGFNIDSVELNMDSVRMKEGSLYLRFDTSGTPPNGILRKIACRWPGLSVSNEWAKESGSSVYDEF